MSYDIKNPRDLAAMRKRAAAVVVPFGKHKGRALASTPVHWRRWCLHNLPRLDRGLRAAIRLTLGLSPVERNVKKRLAKPVTDPFDAFDYDADPIAAMLADEN